MVRIDKGKGKSKGNEKGTWVRVPLQALSNGSLTFGGKGKGKDGYNSAEAQAIREIKEQLRDPSCEGKVWIQQWGPRFQAELGQLRDFLESRPDKFTVIPGEGKKYTVALATNSGVAGGGGASGTPDEAIQEITQLLQQQGGSGKVWIQNWGRRFEETCGSMRDFLESQPDKFSVIPGDGRKFEVTLLKGQRKRPAAGSLVQPTPKKKAKSVGKGTGHDPLIGEAIRTIKEQLSSGTNRVWVPGWGQRFQAQLGSLRDFLESRPDKFTVIPGDGNKFTVEMA
jgi:hypothetical protein